MHIYLLNFDIGDDYENFELSFLKDVYILLKFNINIRFKVSYYKIES